MKDIASFVDVSASYSLHQKVLLILADRSKVTTSQVNLIIRRIDRILGTFPKQDSLPLIVLVQHFSSSSLQFGPVFDSLPFNGWDMTYCDAFGIVDAASVVITDAKIVEGVVPTSPFARLGSAMASDEDNNEENAFLSVNTAESQVQRFSRHASDARRWLTVAFGLDKAPNPADAVNEFQDIAKTEIVVILSTTRYGGDIKGLEKRGIIKSATFYKNSRNRSDFVVSLLSDRSYILATFLRGFTKAWASELTASVQNAAEELISGQSLQSLIERTKSSFQTLLRAYCRHIIILLCENYR